MLYMGIDVGTQGVRCVVVDRRGFPLAEQSVPFDRLNIATVDGWQEQSPDDWWAAAQAAIRSCARQLDEGELRIDAIAGISIDGTSGTIVPVDAAHRPLMNGVMYNDPRAGEEAKAVHAAMGAQEAKLGYKFGASFSLPRILWIKNHRPEIYEKTAMFCHQADFIAGKLCGEYGVSDYSNALKTGYDLIERRWPDEIERALGIDTAKLPRVVRPGEPIAPLTNEAAEALGLSAGTMVVGGSTDGYASALAAGAVKAGSWASIIGTTFVLKGVTDDLILDPSGASYSHRLPSGEWMLGGAGNIGGRTLNGATGGRSFDELNAEAARLIPTGVVSYPLPRRGERFPFVDPACEPFYVGDVTGGRLYPAVMEGVGFAERLAFEQMIRIGCPVGDVIFTAGGACRSELWLKIRASILNRQLRVPRLVDAAMGSALLAASHDFARIEETDAGEGLAIAAENMIVYDKIVDPDPELTRAYADIYPKFLEAVRAIYRWEV